MVSNEAYREIAANIDSLLAIATKLQDKDVVESLQKLQTSIQQDEFSVVVLGEFSRGKSTFINALLGTKLLPMDILPETAVVQILRHSEEPAVRLLQRDGTVVKGEATQAYLSQFSARHGGSNDNIASVEISLPAKLLEHNIVVIDTPGVSDLDEQRAEITYGIIPQADVVLFVLDATSPLKKSEMDFIEKRVLPQGIENIVFLVNKIDNLDEDDIDDGYLTRLTKRINNSLAKNKHRLKDIKVFLISAREALEGKASLEESGLVAVENYLCEMVEQNRVSIRLANLEHKYRRNWQRLYNSIWVKKQLQSAKLNDIEAVQEKLDELIASKEQGRAEITAYVQKEQQVIEQITMKSLDYFFQRLLEDVMDKISTYRNSDIKEYIENRIGKQIRREVENWLGVYGPHIIQLIRKVEQEISHGMSRSFAQEMRVASRQSGIKFANFSIDVGEVQDISNTHIQANAIAAAGAIALGLISGGMLSMLGGFILAPHLNNRMLASRLEAVKQEILPQMESEIVRLKDDMAVELYREIKKRCQVAADNVSFIYDKTLAEYRENIAGEIQQKQAQAGKLQALEQQYAEYMQELNNLKL